MYGTDMDVLTDSKSRVEVLLYVSVPWLASGVTLAGLDATLILSSPAVGVLLATSWLGETGGTKVVELS